NEMSYIQTAGCAASGYVLEYQEGSIEKHFSCEDPDLDEDTIIDIFQRYFDNDSRWKTDRQWTPVDLGYERKRTAAWPIAGVIGLIFLFVLWRYFTATT
ncbi:MAG: hypothetical protein KJO55_10830, partial [Gammaproteobacteria bacterium]|nr:hypothetical protein [Gammaproteobacteria bacterium]